MELLKKCNFVLLSLFIWGLTVLYNGVIVNYLANLFLSFSNPSWLGFIVHILIQLLIICIPTIIVIKYLDLNVKQLLFSIPVMYLLFAVYSPPALYMFVFTGEWLLATISSCYVCVDGFVADYFTIRHCDFNYKINCLFKSDIRMNRQNGNCWIYNERRYIFIMGSIAVRDTSDTLKIKRFADS